MIAISRRELLIGSLFASSVLLNLRSRAGGDSDLEHQIAALERKHGGRLGVAILDTENNRLSAYRGDERFALCSTFKFVAAAFVLARVDRKEESLSRRIVYARDYVVDYSPITEKHAGESGLTVGEICEAALTLSEGCARTYRTACRPPPTPAMIRASRLVRAIPSCPASRRLSSTCRAALCHCVPDQQKIDKRIEELGHRGCISGQTDEFFAAFARSDFGNDET